MGHTTPRRAHSAGFSLLELLVAVSVFALLGAMAYGGLESVLRADRATRAQDERLAELQLAVSILQRDLAQASTRAVRDALGDRQPALSQGQGGLAQLELTRAGWRNPVDRLRSHLQRVRYRVEEDRLQRAFWPMLDRPPGTQPSESVLLDGVESITWRFLDGEGNWHSSWPPATASEPPLTLLPRAVEITLELERWGEIRRLVGVPG